MGKIIISENVSLDGVVQDPTGEEGFRLGGWYLQMGDHDREAWAKLLLAEALGAEALLLGRRTDEWFATRWLSRTGEWADRLNSLPKYVVSATLQEPKWSDSTASKGRVLKGDVVDEVSKLKQELDGDLVVYASSRLVHTLMEHDLVDELRLTVFPVVLGAASGSSARPATRSPCVSSTPGPSATASPSSPTSRSKTPNCRCVDVGRRAPPWGGVRGPPSTGHAGGTGGRRVCSPAFAAGRPAPGPAGDGEPGARPSPARRDERGVERTVSARSANSLF